MTQTIDRSTTAPEIPSLPEYRARVQAWLSANLALKTDDPKVAEAVYEPSRMAANRALQRRVYEAGYAGITYPMEYGGQGLPAEYEAVFKEEAEEFVLPDLGSLARLSALCNAPTILAHGQPEFLRWFLPRFWRGTF